MTEIEFPTQICPLTEVHPKHRIPGSWRDDCPGVKAKPTFKVGDLVATPDGNSVVIFVDEDTADNHPMYLAVLIPEDVSMLEHNPVAWWYHGFELSLSPNQEAS